MVLFSVSWVILEGFFFYVVHTSLLEHSGVFRPVIVLLWNTEHSAPKGLSYQAGLLITSADVPLEHLEFES